MLMHNLFAQINVLDQELNPKSGLEIKSGGRNVTTCHPFLYCSRVPPGRFVHR